MASDTDLLLAYYGDDFTGSTDALEFLSRAGIKTVLFIEPPTPDKLAKYKGLQAIGVAGMTRSMAPANMEQVLRLAFAALKDLNVRHVHYKVCSTFDSSPAIGSIGKSMDVGASIFEHKFIPLLVAAPALGRYCAFGNLFASMGIGSTGQIYRIDRHPSMSKHPVTPADEGDLRLHLAKQTNKKIALLDILDIVCGETDAAAKLNNLVKSGAEVVLFDAIYANQLFSIGQLIDSHANEGTLFSVGSSGIEMALGDYWSTTGLVNLKDSWPRLTENGPLLVISGSCSPVTSVQIEWALENGFAEISIDTAALAADKDVDLENYAHNAAMLIEAGISVVIHTSRGSEDIRITETNVILSEKGLSKSETTSETSRLYGTALGIIARSVARQTALARLLIAGGDTSSFAARAMGIEAVEMIAPLAPGAPLCKVYAPGSPVDGLEVNFKGGQVGAADYFGWVLKGKK